MTQVPNYFSSYSSVSDLYLQIQTSPFKYPHSPSLNYVGPKKLGKNVTWPKFQCEAILFKNQFTSELANASRGHWNQMWSLHFLFPFVEFHCNVSWADDFNYSAVLGVGLQGDGFFARYVSKIVKKYIFLSIATMAPVFGIKNSQARWYTAQ